VQRQPQQGKDGLVDLVVVNLHAPTLPRCGWDSRGPRRMHTPRELAVRFTDTRSTFVSEASVDRLLKAQDLIRHARDGLQMRDSFQPDLKCDFSPQCAHRGERGRRWDRQSRQIMTTGFPPMTKF
jgi:hypothetical protein